MDLELIIAGVIVAFAVFYFVRKIRNTLKGGGCSGGCGCGCSSPSNSKKIKGAENAKCSCKD